MSVVHQLGRGDNPEDELWLEDSDEAKRKASLTSDEPFIDVARRTIATGSMQWLRGAMCDHFSAGMVVAVYDGLSDGPRAKLDAMDPLAAWLLCIKVYARVTSK